MTEQQQQQEEEIKVIYLIAPQKAFQQIQFKEGPLFNRIQRRKANEKLVYNYPDLPKEMSLADCTHVELLRGWSSDINCKWHNKFAQVFHLIEQ